MKLTKIIAVLLLVGILFAGCDASQLLKAPEKQFTQGDVTLTLPIDFLNYSGTDLAKDYAFLYANADIGVLGVQENKEELFAYFGETDVEGYANLIAELYELNTVATQKDGIWTITYSDASSGDSFTYISAFFETEVDFWNIQAYCLTEDFEKTADTLWKYITSAEIAEN